LRVGEQLRADVVLNAGAVEQTLEVTASTIATATETATVATVIDTRTYWTFRSMDGSFRIWRFWRRELPPDGTGAQPPTATARRVKTQRVLSS
jgi:hypothetical protein